MTKISWATTVVGSFPRENTDANMNKAFQDQIDAGIDYPCYPQLVSMIDQFLGPLAEIPDSGLVKKGDKYWLESELKVPEEPVATEYGQFVLDFLERNPDAKSKIKGWKACLTGPFTLAGEIMVPKEMIGDTRVMVYQEPRAIMNGNLVAQLAKLMAKIANAYNDMGADIISMDEPTLGLIVGRRRAFFHKDDEIIATLNEAIRPITGASSVHVCGNVSPKLREILLSTNVTILDHEFANGNNEGLFNRNMFERTDKSLAYGVLKTNVQEKEGGTLETYVEDTSTIKKRMEAAIDSIGKENLIFKPDCGFGGLLAVFGEKFASEIVKEKLTRLTKTMQELE